MSSVERLQPSLPEVTTALEAVDEIHAAFVHQRDMIARAMAAHEAVDEANRENETGRHQLAEATFNFLTQTAFSIFPHTLTKAHKQGAFFPSVKVDGIYFRPQNYMEANLLQAHTLWGDLPGYIYRGESWPRLKRLNTPAFLIGSRTITASQADLLLGAPGRHLAVPQEHTVGMQPQATPGVIFTGTVGTQDLRDLDNETACRKVKYVNSPKTALGPPPELKAAAEGSWPNEFTNQRRIKEGFVGKGTRLRNVRLVTVERIKSGEFTLEGFDHSRRLLDLAIDFDKVGGFKSALQEFVETKQELELSQQ